MKKLIKFFVLSISILSLTCCNDDDPTPAPTTSITSFTAVLRGSDEVPANSSTATGNATLTFNSKTKIFTVSVTHNVASPTAGHIHLGAAGTNGPPVFAFSNLTSPINYTSMALTATEEADLMANRYYVNLHSSTFPDGEIRGQLLKGATTTSRSGY